MRAQQSDISRGIAAAGALAAVLLLAGCGGDGSSAGGSADTAAGAAAADGADAAAGSGSASGGSGGAQPVAKATPGAFPDRTGELVNPDHSTMVFLYYDLTGITPPIDTWVEEDRRVRSAPPPEKAGMRTMARAELQSGAAGVRGVGRLRLSMGANLSDYDPAYGEFTVRALAPSSMVEFNALGQKVSVKFANGRTAQIWKVPASEAQGIRDKIDYAGNISLDVLLRIIGVQPGPGGGTITTEVVEYEMRHNRSGQVIGRVRVTGA